MYSTSTERMIITIDMLGPDYMEAGCPGRPAGSFAEVGIRLILYAKNCLGKRAHKVECAYVIFE